MIRGRRRAWLAGLALSSLLFSTAPASAVASEGQGPQIQPFSTSSFYGTVDLAAHDVAGDYSVQLWQSGGGFHKVGDPVPVDAEGNWSIPDLAFVGTYVVELLVASGAPVLGGFYRDGNRPLGETHYDGTQGYPSSVVLRPVPTGTLTINVHRAEGVDAGGTTEVVLYHLTNHSVVPTDHSESSDAVDPTFVLTGLRAGKDYVIHLSNDASTFIAGYYSYGAAGLLTGYAHATWLKPGATADVTVSSGYASPVIHNITPPSISGTPTVGETLTGDLGTWEGTTGSNPRWFRDGTEIPASGQTTYTLTPEDVGASITFRAFAQRFGFQTTEMFSEPVGPIGKGPALTTDAELTILGTPEVGEELSTESSTWDREDATSTFQWLRDGAPIEGATEATYELAPADLGTEVSVRETATHAAYLDGSVESEAVTVTRGAALTASTLPQVTGAVRVGSTVTVTPATWDREGTQSTFQWLLDGEPITGATGATYAITPADVGSTLTVRETVTHAAYFDGSVESEHVTVTRGAAPTASALPRVTGTARVGGTLSASQVGWGIGGVTSSIQWLRNGTPVPGATGTSFALRAAHLGDRISVRVTGKAAGYDDAVVTSTAVRVAPGAAPRVSKTPAISGKAQLGSSLRAAAPVWSIKGVKTSYQWLRNGKAIKGATKRSYKAARADVGKRLSVRVTGTLTGYSGGTASSSAKKVAKGKPKVTAKAKNVKVGKRAKVTVRVKAAGLARPKGTVTVKYGKKSVKAKLKASAKGKVTVRLPKLKKGKYKITASFKPSKSSGKYVRSAKASRVTLRVR